MKVLEVCWSVNDSCDSFVVFLILSALCSLGSQLNYWRLLYCESKHGQFPDDVSVLNMRMASLAPSLSIIALIIFIFPEYFRLLEAVESAIEGYCFYCYYTMVILYSSRRISLLTSLRETKNKCFCCIPVTRWSAETRYFLLHFFHWQFLFLRPLFTLASGLVEMSRGKVPLYYFFFILELLSLVIAMLGAVRITMNWSSVISELCSEMKFIYVKVIIVIIAVENAVFNGATAEHKSSAEQIARIRLFSFIVTAELLLGSFLLIRTFHSGKRTSMSSCCSHRIVSVATIHPEIASIVDSERIEDGTLRSRGSELCQKSFLKFYWDVLNITAYLDYTPPQCSRGYYQRFETVTNSPRSHPETNRDARQPLPDDGGLESFEKGDLSPPSTLQQLLPAVLQPSGSSELPVMVSSRLETTDFLVGRSDKGTLAATSLDN